VKQLPKKISKNKARKAVVNTKLPISINKKGQVTNNICIEKF
jgi:hypothetical protein